ncbi:fasciclin domain-containing protein [Gramella sp. GC03-9]|uniref:Fasciclin domain-containing protein n=1 Tax=Christiangramia oceanisediminis TaxID=2920386 RepID=A0A9X2R9V5_9FLAO|nr:fasciclin domain-containing protein [Gramella oceanisediminis]MCP9201023.1 fasciclin domain-containing protein [Gramella oceanisediminis]
MALILCFGFIACDEDDDFNPGGEVGMDDGPGESNSIVDFAEDNGYTSLVAAIEAAGLTDELSGDTEYTVFAPDNAAFDAFLADNGFASLDAVPQSVLTMVLMNHVQAGSIMSGDLDTGYYTSMAMAGPDSQAVSLYINTDGGVELNGASTVQSADNEVDNGVVHTVDAVIPLPDITTFATADPTFETLVAALTREDDFDYVDLLMTPDGTDPAPFTVFAPTNDAFTDLVAELEISGLGDIDAATLEAVLNYHVITGNNVTSDELMDGMTVTTAGGATLTINVGDNVTITDGMGRVATVVIADVQATNGVIHAIDTVLMPGDDDGGDGGDESNTIADFVENNDDYSSLFAALEAAGLTSVLDGSDEYTVFAPDNDAFAAFLSDNGFASLDDVPDDLLTMVLMNHVQAGSIMSTDLSTSYIESMAEAGPDGGTVSLYVNTDDGVMLNGMSTVTNADIDVDNGIIHAVDAVIGLPTIATFAMADPDFDTLLAALTREDSYGFAGLLSSNDEPAPYTVFAPTNDAFGDLLTELGVSGLADIDADLLEAVLSYHVVTDANVTSDMVQDGMEVDTYLQDESFTININDNDEVIITDARGRESQIIAFDVQATNGVVHAIDTVLLPSE